MNLAAIVVIYATLCHSFFGLHCLTTSGSKFFLMNLIKVTWKSKCWKKRIQCVRLDNYKTKYPNICFPQLGLLGRCYWTLKERKTSIIKISQEKVGNCILKKCPHKIIIIYLNARCTAFLVENSYTRPKACARTGYWLYG